MDCQTPSFPSRFAQEASPKSHVWGKRGLLSACLNFVTGNLRGRAQTGGSPVSGEPVRSG